jgi:hypothetical protein
MQAINESLKGKSEDETKIELDLNDPFTDEEEEEDDDFKNIKYLIEKSKKGSNTSDSPI